MFFLVAVYVVLFSHLTVDRDFSQNLKSGSYVVFGIIGLVYFLARQIF